MLHLVEMALRQPELFFMPRDSVRLVVGIPTMGRRHVLSAALPQIARQTRIPDEVVICAVAESDVDETGFSDLPFPVRVLMSRPGSCRQRNGIIDATPTSDIVVFLDDDFLMEPSYLARVEQLFIMHPDIAVATGKVLADGILGPGISVADGARLLESRADLGSLSGDVQPIYNAYGCNMTVRMSAVRRGDLRFDENLPLYGWLEDVDFSRMASAHGRVVTLGSLQGIHLGIKVARSSGMRLGYSQVANPIYLMRKGTMNVRHALYQMMRNFAANTVRAWRPEPWVDRRGRLKGNLRAIGDLLRGRLAPQNVRNM